MTDDTTAERLAALQRRRAGSASGKRRRPAEASRVLAAGAGTAAVLTMVTAMAQADQPAQDPVAEVSVPETPIVESSQTVAAVRPTFPDITETPVPQAQVVQTITITPPTRAQVSNGRTNASR